MEIGLPEGFPSLSHWLYNQTDTVLQGLVKQGDPQQVIEYSLALITILNEVTQLVLPKRSLQKFLQSPGELLGQILYNGLYRQGRNLGLYSRFPAQAEAAARQAGMIPLGTGTLLSWIRTALQVLVSC